MSDLFDQAAMRALGSDANLRPRPRTRFEPMIAADASSRRAPEPAHDEPLVVEDDPLAAGATAPDPRTPSVAGRTARLETGFERGVVDGVRADEGRPEPPVIAASTRGDGETSTDSAPLVPLPASTNEPAAPFVEQHRSPSASGLAAAEPIPSAPTRSAAPRIAPVIQNAELEPEPVRVAPSHSPQERAPSRLRTAVVEQAAALSPPPRSQVDPVPLGVRPPVAGDAPPPARSTRDWRDPLGVQARAQIERLSGSSAASLSGPAHAPTPIEITIGRLEIRAESKPAPRAAAKPFAPYVDLATYRSRPDRQR